MSLFKILFAKYVSRFEYFFILSSGAGFIVVLAGEIMTMPGLPKLPAALSIDVDDDGKITGWFDGNLASGVYCGTFTRAKDGKMFDFNLVESGGGAGTLRGRASPPGTAPRADGGRPSGPASGNLLQRG